MCNDVAGGRAARRGFTLIELLITIAVVGLLAAVAYPSYQGSVLKSRRAEAKAALTDAAQRLERYYTENNKYTGAKFCSTGAACTATAKVYSDKSENGYYALTLPDDKLAVAEFVAVAVPQGGQVDDVCGTLTLNQAGVRGVRDGKELDPAKCW